MSLVSLACPKTKKPLIKKDGHWVADAQIYQEIDGIPILINDENSLFKTATIIQDHLQTKQSTKKSFSIKRSIINILELIPEPNGNFKGPKLVGQFVKMIEGKFKTAPANVLIIGAGERGSGLELLQASKQINLIESDISVGGDLVCDAHDLPFLDSSIDAVICQAVLEHVIDPNRCVSEIHRILTADGLVFVSVPFMQQVHMGGRHDYTRFTNLGLRNLMRNFEEIDRGTMCGPAMALTWSIRYFLLSLTSNKTMRVLLDIAGRKLTGPLKLLDYLIIDTPGASDAASANYFIGQKSTTPLSVKSIPKLYRGGI